MERITVFHKALLDIMVEISQDYQSNENAEVKFHQIVDEKNHRYELVAVGWLPKSERVFNVFFQADIINNKIWIQEDNNEYSIAEQLVDRGIRKKDIVLAYYPEFHRQLTEYAVA
jgi:XisI protein